MVHGYYNDWVGTPEPQRTAKENQMSNDRDKALEMALSQIDKQFGKGSIMKMGEKGSLPVASVSTGALILHS